MGLIYCIICFVLFLVAGIITQSGFSGISLLAEELVNTFNGLSAADAIDTSNNISLFVYVSTLVQSTYISKAISKITNKESELDQFFIFCGNIALGCFLGLMYQSFPYEYLHKIMNILLYVVMGPSLIVMVIATIIGMYKVGMLKFSVGIMLVYAVVAIAGFHLNIIVRLLVIIFGIVMIIAIILTNPIMLGITVAFLPPIVVLLVLGVISMVIPIPGIVLLFLSFAMSYPLSEACGNFLEGAVENYSQTVSIVIDSLFFIFSIFMIGLWVKTVVISPKTPSIEIADEAIEVPSGRVKHHGYVGEDGLWQLYTNGYLEFNGDDLYKYDEFVLPWDEYKDEIFYIKIDDSVRNIDERWFLNYKKLEAVYLPADLEFISEKAFQGCDNLGKFDISETNPNYCCENGILLSKDKTELILCPNKKISQFLPKATYENNWYLDLISNKKLLYPCTQWNTDKPSLYYARQFSYYEVKDIDSDGIEEIFLATKETPTVDDIILMICVDKSGDVHCIKAMDTSTGGYFCTGDRRLISCNRIAGVEHYIVEEYSNGSVTPFDDLYCLNKEDEQNAEFHSGDAVVSRAEYEKLYKSYQDECQRIEYHPISNS